MEIRVTYGDLLNPQFKQSFMKLSVCNLYSPKKAEKIATIANRLSQTEKMAYQLKASLMDKFFVKNEKGEFEQIKEEPFFKLKEECKLEDFDKEWRELTSLSRPIFKAKIDLSELPEKVGLSPQDLYNLRKVLHLSEEYEESLSGKEETTN